MRRVLRFLLMLVLCMFVLLNLHILANFQPNDGGTAEYREIGAHIMEDRPHVQRGKSVDGYLIANASTGKKSQFIIPPNFFNGSDSLGVQTLDTANLSLIAEEISTINENQKIANINKFGLQLTQESVVIVVQVHDRLEYLKLLLDSLRDVRNIEKSLLIISHDVFSTELNNLVSTVDFCPVSSLIISDSSNFTLIWY